MIKLVNTKSHYAVNVPTKKSDIDFENRIISINHQLLYRKKYENPFYDDDACYNCRNIF